MARTDNDTWDLASSVGATATMVAAQRALASRDARLIDDPFAEPLVRAVGVDFFTRFLDGEIDLAEVGPEFNLRTSGRGNGRAHPVFRQVASSMPPPPACTRPSSWPPAWMREPTGCRGRTAPSSTRSTSRTLSSSRPARLPTWGLIPPRDRRPVGIDLREDWPKALLEPVSTLASRPRGSPRGC